MKNQLRWTFAFAMAFMLLFSHNGWGQNEQIHYFNFNENTPPNNTNWAQPIEATIGNGELTYTFTEAFSFGGTTVNGNPGEVNGGSFVPRGGAEIVNNGEHFVLSIPTTGYEDIVLTYATQRTATGFSTQTVEYTIDGIDWIEIAVIDDIPSSFGLRTVDFSAIAEANENDDFAVRFILDGATAQAGNNRFDNISVSGLPAGMVAAPVFNPNGGTFFSPVDIIIDTATEDATIFYSFTSDGGPWEEYTIPVTIDETTTIWAYATADDLDDSNVASAEFVFPDVVDVNDIAELRDQEQDGTVYRLTNEVILTFQTASRNQKYIQDASGAILIDDFPGNLSTEYDIYDGITGITGTLGEFQNMLQFIPVVDAGGPTSTGNVLEPILVTLEDLDQSYEAHLVKIINVDIDPDGDDVFESAESYTITDDTGTGTLRTNYFDLDYIGEPIPEVAQDITGLVHQRFAVSRLVPRSLDDFVEHEEEDDPGGITEFPWVEGFDEGELPEDWETELIQGPMEWTFFAGGVDALVYIFSDSEQGFGHVEATLTTPRLNLTGHDVVTFGINHKYYAETAIDFEAVPLEEVTGYIEISIDGGDTWQVIEEMYNDELLDEPVFVQYDISEIAANEPNVKIRFNADIPDFDFYYWIVWEIFEVSVSTDAIATYDVTFDIVDADGLPLADAVVTLDGETNAAGEYVFTDLPQGSYDYLVELEGYHDATGTVQVVDEDVTVNVEMDLIVYTVTFNVQNTNFVDVDDAVVTFDGVTNDPGDYVFVTVPGTFDYTVLADGYLVYTGDVEVTDDITVPVFLEFEEMPPVALPFAEDFSGYEFGDLPLGWARTTPYWQINDSNEAGGVAPEMTYNFINADPAPHDDPQRLHTPWIDAGMYDEITLSFSNHLIDNLGFISPDTEVQVQMTTDGDNWDVLWQLALDDFGPETTVIELDGLSGEQFMIAFVIEKAAGFEPIALYWYIDDILIEGVEDVVVIDEFPWLEGFEDEFPPMGWTVSQLSTSDGNWALSDDAYEGEYAAYHHDFNADHDSWLITPAIVLEDGVDYLLSFYEKNAFMSWYGYSGVLISTGSGDAGSDDFVEVYESDATLTAYALKEIPLSDYAGETIYIAFVYQGLYVHRWWIDNVSVDVYVPPVLYTVTFEVEDEEGNPIDNAVITLADMTNDAGDYVFEAPVGEHEYLVTAPGYDDFGGLVEVVDEDVDVLVVLVEETPAYCEGGPTFTVDSNVEHVHIMGANGTEIDHVGCPGVVGVEDLTDFVVDLHQGQSYTLYVTFGTCGTWPYAGAGSVWIDWAQDFVFDAEDLIHESTGTPGTAPWDDPIAIEFTVPLDAELGHTVMRVQQQEGGSLPLDPCAIFSWGSVMDFTINVLEEEETPPLPLDLIFNQPYFDGGTAAASAIDTAAEIDYEVADNFSGLEDEIEEFVFYGLAMKFDDGWEEMEPADTEPFFIRFYEYAEGETTGLIAPVSGDYEIGLLDSFGDGWNDGMVTVYVNGVAVLTDITLPSGAGPEYHEFYAEEGDEISTSYTPGSWSYENYYAIIDPDGNIIAEDGGTWSNPGASTPVGIDPGGDIAVLEPGWATPLYEFYLDAEVTHVGPIWNGQRQLYKFVVAFEESVNLEEGWISAQIDANEGSGTWFLWLNSLAGDEVAWQRTAAVKTAFSRDMVDPRSISEKGQLPSTRDMLDYDLAFELYGGELTDPPLCASNPAPADMDVDVEVDGTLSWSSVLLADGYILYFGEAGEGWNLVDGDDLGAVTAYEYAGLDFETAYEWKVVPYNMSGEAEDCPVWTFTTEQDPDITIDVFPWVEDFEAELFPPLGWNRVNVAGPTQWIRSTAQNHTPDGVASAFVNWNSASTENFLITPAVDPDDDIRLRFYVRKQFGGAWPPDDLEVWVSTTGDDVENFTDLLLTIDVANLPANAWNEFEINLDDYTDEVFYVAFRHLQTGGNGMWLDDVTFEYMPTDPIFAISAEALDFGTVAINQESMAQQITITNEGVGVLMVEAPVFDNGADFILHYNADDFPAALEADESIDFEVSFAPLDEGVQNAEVLISFNDGEDQTAVVTLTGEGFDPLIDTFPYVQNFDETEMPLRWSVIDNSGSGFVWEFPGGWAIADSDAAQSGNDVHTTLLSPIFDVSALNNPRVAVDHFYRHLGANAYAAIHLSLDGGDWENLATFTSNQGSGSTFSPTFVEVVLLMNELLNGAQTFQFAFEYNDGGAWAWYWLINAFSVQESYTASFDVTDVDGNPFDEASISINGMENDPGNYFFDGLMPGDYSYTVSAEGYFDVEGEFSIIDESVEIDVEMIKIPVNIMLVRDIPQAPQGGITTIELEVLNDEEFVGFNADLVLPEGVTFVDGSEQLHRAADDHILSFAIQPGNVARMISISFTNSPYTGNEGVLVSFDVMAPEAPGVYDLLLDDVVLGNIDLENILTETIDGTLTVLPTVSFTVLDEIGDPLDRAIVTLGDMDPVELAEGQNEYVFENVLPGTYEYSVSRACYFTEVGMITVLETENKDVVEELLPNVLLGDANGDGAVNILDIIAVANYFTGAQSFPFCFDNADVNGDGVINLLDMIGIWNIIDSSKAHPYPSLVSDAANIYIDEEGIVLDSDGTLSGLQFELKGSGIHNLDMQLQLPGHEITYFFEDGSLFALVYSINGSAIDKGMQRIVTFEDNSLIPEWGSVLAGNINAEEVPVNTFTGITGIGQIEGEFDFSVFPNPALQNIWVTFNNQNGDPASVSLVNIQGQIIETKVSNSMGHTEIQFNLDDITPGLYLIRLENERGSFVERVMVK